MWKFFKSIFSSPSIVSANYDRTTEIMMVEFSDGTISSYKGSGTQWKSYPSTGTLSVLTNRTLSILYEYIKQYNKPYTTAHQ